MVEGRGDGGGGGSEEDGPKINRDAVDLGFKLRSHSQSSSSISTPPRAIRKIKYKNTSNMKLR